MPARALRILIRDEAHVMIESMWEEKMKWVSNSNLVSSFFFPELADTIFLIFDMAEIIYFIPYLHIIYSSVFYLYYIFKDLYIHIFFSLDG